MPRQPNVMFIIADQHNAKCLGVAGHPQVKTPHLDDLVRRSVRFTSAVTTSPICTPSRLSYLTGKYSHNHGFYGNGGNDPDEHVSILGHLRRNGYKTASIGHINQPKWQERQSDFFRDAYPSALPSQPPAGPYDVYLEKAGLRHLRDDMYYPEQGEHPAGCVMDGRPSPLSFDHTVEGWCVREMKEFVDSCGDQPWFCYLGLPHPHSNYCPAQEFWDLYDHENIWLPPNFEYPMEGKAPHLRRMKEGARTSDWWLLFEPRTPEAGFLRKQHGYFGCISQVDHAVGQTMAFLAERGLLEDTIVIYTADHGDYACEHGVPEKAPGICGDAICRVPSIWHWQGRFKEGHVTDAVIQNVDLAPTLLSLLGLPPMPTVDGEDIRPLLEGRDAPVRAFGVTEHAWSKALLKGNWRLVYYPRRMFADDFDGKEFGELYDLGQDPWEMHNLFFSPEHQDKIRELQRDLMDFLMTTSSVKTILPWVKPKEGGGDGIYQHREADDRLHWRDVEETRKQVDCYI